jgi:hypothetical protein
MSKALHRLTHGDGRKQDADYLVKIADNIPGGKHDLRVRRSLLPGRCKVFREEVQG